MYVYGKGGTIVATSPDGNNFSFRQAMSPPDWGTTAPVLLPDGRLRLYAFEQRVPIGNAVGSFLSSDGLNWEAEPGRRLQANADEQITDPFVIRWRGGWKMYFKIAPAPTTGGAFPLDANSRDAALILSLPPGGYTAQLSGVNGTTGIGLIEVYELPPGTAAPAGEAPSSGRRPATAATSTNWTAQDGQLSRANAPVD